MRILAIIAAMAAGWGETARAETLVVAGSYDWDTISVVGVSGLEVSDDGNSFTAISDRGWFLAGQFARTDGQISGIAIDRFLPILGQDGLPVAARRIGDWSDAEGLAIAPDGRMWIAFERWARVAAHAAPESPAEWIKDHPDFATFSDNRQLEALAIGPDGTVYALPEQPTDDGFPLFRLDGATWTIAGHIAPANGFAVVGADFDGDGRLYLLERKLILGLWWQSRVRRVALDTLTTETLWTSPRDVYGNLEGLAVWHDNGTLRLTLVSDNNGDAAEPTRFVELRPVE